MKRTVSFLLALSLIAILVACNSSGNTEVLETEAPLVESSTPAPTPTPSPIPTIEPTPTATPDPTIEPTPGVFGYDYPRLSTNDFDTFLPDFFSVASSLAPDDIADVIHSNADDLAWYDTEYLYDTYVGLGGCRLHFIQGNVVDKDFNMIDDYDLIRFIQGAIPVDDAAPYYLASLLHFHRGTSLDQSIADALRYIDYISSDEDPEIYSDDDGIYNIMIDKCDKYYYFEMGYSSFYAENSCYAERIEANRTFMLLYSIIGFPDD